MPSGLIKFSNKNADYNSGVFSVKSLNFMKFEFVKKRIASLSVLNCIRRSDSGVAVLEFAIVLVAMLIITGGSLSYGLLFFEEQTIIEAIRVGTRSAATAPVGTAPDIVAQRIQDSIFTFMTNSGIDSSSYGVKISPIQVPLEGGTNQSGVTVILIHRSNMRETFGQIGISTVCFSGTTLLEGSNTATAYADTGMEGC